MFRSLFLYFWIMDSLCSTSCFIFLFSPRASIIFFPFDDWINFFTSSFSFDMIRWSFLNSWKIFSSFSFYCLSWSSTWAESFIKWLSQAVFDFSIFIIRSSKIWFWFYFFSKSDIFCRFSSKSYLNPLNLFRSFSLKGLICFKKCSEKNVLWISTWLIFK